MVEMESLAGKVFSLLKGNGFKIKIYDEDGNETTNPNEGRRFFVMDPNIMVTIDEKGNTLEFSKGSTVDASIDALQKNVRRLADEFLMNSDIKVFGKTIQPRDYAYKAKMPKDDVAVMESTHNISVGDKVVATTGRFGVISGIVRKVSGDEILVKTADNKLYSLDSRQCTVVPNKVKEEAELRAVNHHLIGEIMKTIKVFGGRAHESDLSSNLNVGHDLAQLRSALNRLVQQGKLTAEMDKNGYPVYAIAMEETVMESFSKMFGTLKTSQQTLENVRILVRHKTPIDENVRGARARQISAIFLECNGERFRFPHNNLAGARAMAQHLAHGGAMYDKVGAYITESVGQLLKLQSFNRYVTANKLINEDSSGIVETVKENIETLRTEIKKLSGSKTYETVKARIETFERETLAEDDISQLKDLFTIRRFDEKFEEVLPIVKQLIQEKDTFHKRIEEAAGNAIVLRREAINTTPMFEFASDNARLGFKLSELSLRIVENDELAGFINKIGTKLCKEGAVNDFERAVLTQVFENLRLEDKVVESRKDIKEALDLDAYFDKYTMNFF